MRTVISSAIIIAASVVGFFMGTGLNQAMGGANIICRNCRLCLHDPSD